jgi:hypothetical protein
MSSKEQSDVPVTTLQRARGAVGEGADMVFDVVKGRLHGVKQTADWASLQWEELRERIDAISDAGKSVLKSVRQSVDLAYQLRTLHPGDRYHLQVGAAGHAEGIKLFGQGMLRVTRKGDGFLLLAEGDMGGGILRELGARLGEWKLGGSIELLLAAGVGAELHFQTVEETQRTIELLLRLSTLSAMGRLLEGLPLADKIIPEQVLDVFRLTDEEREYLLQRADAILFRGQIVPELALALGISGRFAHIAGLFAQGQNRDHVEARFLLGEDREPEALTLDIGVSCEVAWGSGWQRPADAQLVPEETPRHLASFVLSQHFRLPPAWNERRREEGWLPALRALATEIVKSKQDRIRLCYESTDPREHAARLLTELVLIGDWRELVRMELISKALQGQVEELLTEAGDQLRMEVSLSSYAMRGLKLDPGFGLMGVGGGVQLKAIREERLDDPSWEAEGTAGQLAKEVGVRLRQGREWVADKMPSRKKAEASENSGKEVPSQHAKQSQEGK